VAGLARGLLLLRQLVVLYWDGLYPRIDPPEEGGGCEARIAPLEWLGASMVHTLRTHVGLLPLAQRKVASVSLADWERLISRELSATAADSPASKDALEPPLTREEIVANVARYRPQVVGERLVQVREARSHLAALVDLLQGHLGPQAPHLRKLEAVLEALERVLLQVAQALPAREATPDSTQTPGSEEDDMPAEDLNAPDPRDEETDSDTQPPPHAGAPVGTGGWRNRDEAYQTLEALARYLSAIEPHSPTPYLIRRAVNWGRLPLPELMAEIMEEEGDLNRMVQLLGLRR
jgi:type VI secretion system protein ImpA